MRNGINGLGLVAGILFLACSNGLQYPTAGFGGDTDVNASKTGA